MAKALYNKKGNHQIIVKSVSGENVTNLKTFELYVPTSYTFGTDYSIVVFESVLGDGGVSYNNGRVQEVIPITGILLGDNQEDLKRKITELRKIADNKSLIEFVYPLKTDIRTNYFYIQSIKFTPESGSTNEINFTLDLTEKRDANVKTIQVNLVNYAPAETMSTLYKTFMGAI